MRGLNIVLCVLSLGCRPSASRPTDARRAASYDAQLGTVDPPRDASVVHGQGDSASSGAVAPRPSLRATEISGAATLDSTLRVRSSSGAHPTLPGDGPSGLSALTLDRGALPGDVIATGQNSRVTLGFGRGSSVALGPDATVELPSYAGASLLLTLGLLEARSEGGEALRIDTPSARVIVSSGRCVVGVSRDGSVGLWASASGVTVWASPPPPAQRSTRLTPEERARLRARASHPVLLDVDIPELAARDLRPCGPIGLAEGASLGFDPLGMPHARPPPARPTRLSFDRWIAARALEPRPYAHLFPIGQLSRAGAGDLSDVRVVMARIRASGSAMTLEVREGLLAGMSLALGRATARARRGRELASRGGDSTALVQLAPVEAVTEASWALAPLGALK